MHHFQNVLQAASDMKKKSPTSYIQSGMMTDPWDSQNCAKLAGMSSGSQAIPNT